MSKKISRGFRRVSLAFGKPSFPNPTNFFEKKFDKKLTLKKRSALRGTFFC